LWSCWAIPQAIDLLLAIPVTRAFFPVRSNIISAL
jgi:hypothetical protein